MVRDIPTHPLKHISIDGPVGTLKASLEEPLTPPRAVVLCLHPHPLHGGTRQNNVVRYGALGALKANCVALRLDFRGVGDSAGNYDEGVGEQEDAYAACLWLRERYKELPLFIWGFSFGSRVGLDLAIRLREELQGFIAVAWPTNIYDWPPSPLWPLKTAFIFGSDDEYVDPSKMEHVKHFDGKISLINDASHFFPQHLNEVRDFTFEYIQEFLNA